MAIKIIKFDLPINGIKVKNLEELRDNLTDEIVTLARSGQLERWFKSRQMEDMAKTVVAALASQQEGKALFLALCNAMNVEVHPDDVNAIFDESPIPGNKITKNIWDSKIMEIKIPASIGNSGTITEWKVKIGDFTTTGQVIVAVETDQGIFNITTPIKGILIEILIENSAVINYNELIALIYVS